MMNRLFQYLATSTLCVASMFLALNPASGQSISLVSSSIDRNTPTNSTNAVGTSTRDDVENMIYSWAGHPAWCWNFYWYVPDGGLPAPGKYCGTPPSSSCGSCGPSSPGSSTGACPPASIPHGQAGDPAGCSKDFNQVINAGAWIEPLRSNSMHIGEDYVPNADSFLAVRRYHQSRAHHMDSSLGRGSFLNFDVRLFIEPPGTVQFGIHMGQQAEIFDPSSFAKLRFRDGNGSSTSALAPWDNNRNKGLFFFDDQMNPHNYVIDASSLSTAKYARLDLWDGGHYLFELVSLDDPTAATSSQVGTTPTHGRLVEIKNSCGFGVDISYKAFTATELSQSPSRLWQIDTVTDHLSQSLSFSYLTSQVGGVWAVDKITVPGGDEIKYTYDGNYLSRVEQDTDTRATFDFQLSSYNDPGEVAMNSYSHVRWDVDDLNAAKGHRHKSVYLSASASESGGNVLPTSVGLTLGIANGEHELMYLTMSGSTQDSDRTIYEGGGQLKRINWASNTDDYDNIYYSDGWSYNGSVSGSAETKWAVKVDNSHSGHERVGLHLGAPDESFDSTGVHRDYSYDGIGNVTYIDFDDGTFESYCYNANQQVTRFRDRNGNVTLTTYDSSNRRTSVARGLKDSTSNTPSVDPYGNRVYDRCATDDVQTGSYGITQWQYYASGNGAGLVSKMIDPLGNETDYQYNSSHLLSKVIQPADVAGGTRPETNYTYYANGNVKTVTDPEGNIVEYFYDDQGCLISTLYPDGTTEKRVYGTSGNAEGLIEKTIDRNGVVTLFQYDAADRMTSRTTAYAVMDGTTENETPDVALLETWTYVNGSESIDEYRRAGALTKYIYDYRGRRVQTLTHVDASTILAMQKHYVDNRLDKTEDPFGREKFYAYESTDGRLIRTIQATTPEYILTKQALSLTRDASANAGYIIQDYVFDAVGRIERSHDGRNMATAYEYDNSGRRTASVADSDYTNRGTLSNLGAALAFRTETDYDAAGNTLEVRSPRYFDAGDALGHQNAKETYTYTGRGLVASRTTASGSPVQATESYVYDLNGRKTQQTDYAGKVWKTHYEDCCGHVTASENPLGHGSIGRTNAGGQTIHSASVADYTDHVVALDNPIDAKTLRESTTRYDTRGRAIARTTWLVARGIVDQNMPPIAGLDGIPATDGFTTQYLYDDDVTDSVGLDSAAGVTPLLGGTAIKLADAITKLGEAEANGGANTTLNAGSARVTITPTGEVSFSISNGADQVAISGMLDATNSSLITWSCTAPSTTTNLSGYGTVLVSKRVDALGNTTSLYTDAAGRTIESHDALGKVTEYTYDAAGNRLSVRDPNNVGQDCTYDALGRDLSCTDTTNITTSSTYDAAGNKISNTDGKGNSTSYEFDARGRQTKQTDRLNGNTILAYTMAGQLQSLTDAENQVTTYTYDDAGFKLTETYPDHTPGTSPGNTGYGIVTFTPDAAGRTVLKQDQLGDSVTYNYDLAGRLTSRDYRTAANSPAGPIADTDSFTYDDSGRMLTAESQRYANEVTYGYDNAGRKATESLEIANQTYTTTTNYNSLGQISGYIYPDGTVVDRAYTDRGQLHTITVAGSVIDTRTYDDGGRMLTSTYANGVSESRSYNNDNTLASINFTGAPIGNLSYGWDNNKNKTSESITGTMSGYGFDVGFNGYDSEDRLTNWNRSDFQLNQSWSLSAVGDWNSVTKNGSVQNRTHGPTHELLTAAGQAMTHDAKGNVTSIPAILRPGSDPLAMTWDFDNRMSSSDVDNDGVDDVAYKFDALGRRVARDDGTNITVYVQAGQQTIADYPAGVAQSAPTYKYFYASYIDEPVMRAGGSGDRYFHRTQQYSVTALTDSSGNVTERYAYTAYGTPTITDGTGTTLTTSAENNRYTYTGREWDADLELYHFRARMYDAISGRFCSRDPIGYGDGLGLFAFGKNSPLFGWDPSGHEYVIGNANDDEVGRSEDGRIIYKHRSGKCYVFINNLAVVVRCPPNPNPPQRCYATTLALPVSGSSAACDGPLPIGDTIAVVIIVCALAKDALDRPWDPCWRDYRACVLTALSGYFNRCWDCYRACGRSGGTWYGDDGNGNDCDYWNY